MKTFVLFILGFTIVCPAHSFSQVLGVQDSEEFVWLRISRGGLLVVRITAADTIFGNFILDTGAGIHLISAKLLARLAHEPAGRFVAFRHNGERVEFDMFRIPSISIGSRHERDPQVGVWAMLDSLGIDGILSASFFRGFPVTIDLRDSLLVFETEKSLLVRKERGEHVPMTITDVRGISLDLFARFRAGDNLELECLIDTGSPETVLDGRYAGALGIRPDQPGVERRKRKSLFGANEEEILARIPVFALEQAPEVRSNRLKVVFKDNLIYDGIVGTDFWMGRTLTLNISERYLVVGGP
jgi:hypothetical protein